MLRDLLEAAPYLFAVGAGVMLLVILGRDPKADEHDLSDYHEPDEVTPQAERLHRLDLAAVAAFTSLVVRDAAVPLDDEPDHDILPPAPPGMNAGSPLYAETLFRSWHPQSPTETAERFLLEIRDEALAGLDLAR